MSVIHVPDQHPGRCLNMRVNTGPNGETEWLRCLDYAAVPHICSFPEQRKWVSQDSWIMSTYRAPKPTPWVKPGDAPRSTTGDAS